MLKKLILISLLSTTFSSCVFFIKDDSRAVHPIVNDTSALVYVKVEGVAKAVNTFRIGNGTVPIWCDVDEKYANFLVDRASPKKTIAICYSDKTPPLQDEQVLPKGGILAQYNEQGQGFFSIEESLNPFSRAYAFSVSIGPSNYDDFFIFYFDLYRKFCKRTGVSCCMTGDGKDFKFKFILEEPENVKQLYMELDSVVTYANTSHREYKNTLPLYGIFSSNIYDKCSFNRWYYDALAVGLVSPESFIEVEKWERSEGKAMWARVKNIEVKLIDYQKISSEDKRWLEGSLKKLSQGF